MANHDHLELVTQFVHAKTTKPYLVQSDEPKIETHTLAIESILATMLHSLINDIYKKSRKMRLEVRSPFF